MRSSACCTYSLSEIEMFLGVCNADGFQLEDCPRASSPCIENPGKSSWNSLPCKNFNSGN